MKQHVERVIDDYVKKRLYFKVKKPTKILSDKDISCLDRGKLRYGTNLNQLRALYETYTGTKAPAYDLRTMAMTLERMRQIAVRKMESKRVSQAVNSETVNYTIIHMMMLMPVIEGLPRAVMQRQLHDLNGVPYSEGCYVNISVSQMALMDIGV